MGKDVGIKMETRRSKRSRKTTDNEEEEEKDAKPTSIAIFRFTPRQQQEGGEVKPDENDPKKEKCRQIIASLKEFVVRRNEAAKQEKEAIEKVLEENKDDATLCLCLGNLYEAYKSEYLDAELSVKALDDMANTCCEMYDGGMKAMILTMMFSASKKGLEQKNEEKRKRLEMPADELIETLMS